MRVAAVSAHGGYSWVVLAGGAISYSALFAWSWSLPSPDEPWLATLAAAAAFYAHIGWVAAWQARRDVSDLLTMAYFTAESDMAAIAYLVDRWPAASFRLLWPPAWYRYVRGHQAIDIAIGAICNGEGAE